MGTTEALDNFADKRPSVREVGMMFILYPILGSTCRRQHENHLHRPRDLTDNTMKILVCGGRDYGDAFKVGAALAPLKPSIVIQGGCPTGADALAKEWALRHKVHVWTFLADWKTHGRKTGPLRNQWMLDDSKPDLVLAFPGGRDTADMVRRAKKAGVKVIEIS